MVEFGFLAARVTIPSGDVLPSTDSNSLIRKDEILGNSYLYVQANIGFMAYEIIKGISFRLDEFCAFIPWVPRNTTPTLIVICSASGGTRLKIYSDSLIKRGRIWLSRGKGYHLLRGRYPMHR